MPNGSKLGMVGKGRGATGKRAGAKVGGSSHAGAGHASGSGPGLQKTRKRVVQTGPKIGESTGESAGVRSTTNGRSRRKGAGKRTAKFSPSMSPGEQERRQAAKASRVPKGPAKSLVEAESEIRDTDSATAGWKVKEFSSLLGVKTHYCCKKLLKFSSLTNGDTVFVLEHGGTLLCLNGDVDLSKFRVEMQKGKKGFSGNGSLRAKLMSLASMATRLEKTIKIARVPKETEGVEDAEEEEKKKKKKNKKKKKQGTQKAAAAAALKKEKKEAARKKKEDAAQKKAEKVQAAAAASARSYISDDDLQTLANDDKAYDEIYRMVQNIALPSSNDGRAGGWSQSEIALAGLAGTRAFMDGVHGADQNKSMLSVRVNTYYRYFAKLASELNGKFIQGRVRDHDSQAVYIKFNEIRKMCDRYKQFRDSKEREEPASGEQKKNDAELDEWACSQFKSDQGKEFPFPSTFTQTEGCAGQEEAKKYMTEYAKMKLSNVDQDMELEQLERD
eukprot:gene24022-32449_t